jgi:hypothetical protein
MLDRPWLEKFRVGMGNVNEWFEMNEGAPFLMGGVL